MSTFPSVRTYIRISTATTVRISVKFCIGVCYEKGCRVYQLAVENGVGEQGGLHDDLSAFYCCRRHKVAIKDL